MRRRSACAALVVGAVLAVTSTCGGTAPESGERPRIRVAYAAGADVEDLPSLIAHAELRREGYTVEEVYFSISELGAEALVRGQVEFAVGSVRSFWAAASRGAPIRTVMEHAGNGHRLVAIREITHCRDLHGRRLGLQSEGSGGTTFARALFAEACPSLTPETLLVPQSENRAAALLSGNLDAAVLQLAAFHWLDRQAPGRFHIVEDFAARWPLVKVSGVQVNREFAAAHPQLIRDYVAARLRANRTVAADPSLLTAAAARYIRPDSAWPDTIRPYLENDTWAAAGGFDQVAAVQNTLAFLQRYGGLRSDLQIADVADLLPLSAALSDPRLAAGQR